MRDRHSPTALSNLLVNEFMFALEVFPHFSCKFSHRHRRYLSVLRLHYGTLLLIKHNPRARIVRFACSLVAVVTWSRSANLMFLCGFDPGGKWLLFLRNSFECSGNFALWSALLGQSSRSYLYHILITSLPPHIGFYLAKQVSHWLICVFWVLFNWRTHQLRRFSKLSHLASIHWVLIRLYFRMWKAIFLLLFRLKIWLACLDTWLLIIPRRVLRWLPKLGLICNHFSYEFVIRCFRRLLAKSTFQLESAHYGISEHATHHCVAYVHRWVTWGQHRVASSQHGIGSTHHRIVDTSQRIGSAHHGVESHQWVTHSPKATTHHHHLHLLDLKLLLLNGFQSSIILIYLVLLLNQDFVLNRGCGLDLRRH